MSGNGASPVSEREPESRGNGGALLVDVARPDTPVAFGPFSLLPAQRRLERDGAPVRLGAKAFEILELLVGRAGQVVGKAELMAELAIAREENLRFHVTALRKALGEGRYIVNSAGQGYSFVAPIASPAAAPRAEARATSARPLPVRPRRLVGRDDVLGLLAEQLLEHRFATLVGPGGVGKTSVGLALAHDLAARFGGDVCFCDVGAVFNPDLLAGALASALGIPAQTASAAPGIVTFLQGRRMLLVLDGCEPAIDAAAALAEQLFLETPQVHILATSREALGAEGEHVHRLAALDCPGTDGGQTADQALRFAAVQLFADQAASGLHGFVLTDEDAPFVSETCRKLDGLPLAIELAASRVSAFGVREVARQLEAQFALMWPGRRTALPRHQTLGATLGWSHQLLSPHERLLFRRLSVFAGVFTVDMAVAAAADEQVSRAEAMELLGSLVSKSLVQFNTEATYGSYRFLDMTRAYAFEQLRDADEVGWMAERHARLIRRLLEGGGASEGRRTTDLLDDVGAAIEWSLSREGDPELAAALAAASAPVWLQAGLLMECRFWMTRVLTSVEAPALDAHRRLTIQAAMASAETFTEGFTADSFKNWQSAFATAESLGDIGQQLTCLVVLWAHKIRAPELGGALSFARQTEALTAPLPDAGARAMADWMVGISHHHRGELAEARAHLQASLAGDTLEARQAMMAQLGYDRGSVSMAVLGNLHWLAGRPDAAVRLGAAAVAEARRSPYPVPLSEALGWQALNLHLRGDDPQRIDALLDEAVAVARPHFIESYLGLALALKGLNAAARDLGRGGGLVSEGLELLSKSNYEVFHPFLRTEFARRRAVAGERLSDSELGGLLDLDALGPENWSSPEAMRNAGEIFLLHGEAARAAQLFAGAAASAERQGALGWALRVALSVARSTAEQGARRADERLAGLLQRFTEGAETADLQAARAFLAGRA